MFLLVLLLVLFSHVSASHADIAMRLHVFSFVFVFFACIQLLSVQVLVVVLISAMQLAAIILFFLRMADMHIVFATHGLAGLLSSFCFRPFGNRDVCAASLAMQAFSEQYNVKQIAPRQQRIYTFFIIDPPRFTCRGFVDMHSHVVAVNVGSHYLCRMMFTACFPVQYHTYAHTASFPDFDGTLLCAASLSAVCCKW